MEFLNNMEVDKDKIFKDFHYYSTKGNIKTAYIGLGADLQPGLHHPDMKFELDALVHGTKILVYSIFQRLIS